MKYIIILASFFIEKDRSFAIAVSWILVVTKAARKNYDL